MKLNEGLEHVRVLQERLSELKGMRDENSYRYRRYDGGDDKVIREPQYDVSAIDSMCVKLAKEIRLLKSAMKLTNATVDITGYTPDESVLEAVPPKAS